MKINSVLFLTIVLTVILVGCVPGGGYTGDLKDPYRFHKIGTIVDKLEEYRGKEYVIEVVNAGDLVRGEVSKTEFERAVIGQQVYYRPATLLTDTEIIVPNLEGLRLHGGDSE